MKKNIFTGNTRIFMTISAAIIAVALVMTIIGFGMNMGIDFTGGSMLTYDMGGEFDSAVIEEALTSVGITDFQVAQTGEGDIKDQLQIRIKQEQDSDDTRVELENKIKETYPDMTFVQIEYVGAVAGRDLISNAIKSMLIAFVCMLIYIGIRFDVLSGLAALLALCHDVLIMCAFMVFFRGTYQVNSSFIAALLTIVGYSINDTIVIFDRIRENAKNPANAHLTRKEVVEKSVQSTISRTINTTLTTLFTLVSVYVLGVSSIKEFAFPLVVGMCAGIYSSVLLSGQFWAHWIDNDSFKAVRNLFKKDKTEAKKA